MCSRYENHATPQMLIDRFGVDTMFGAPPIGEVRPTDEAVVILAGRSAALAHWGLPTRERGGALINARAESLARKPTFRPLLQRRCLIPATAYFEWRRVGDARLRNRITPTDGRPFGLAGLRDAEGRFVIVTCAPATGIAHIHDRMPVILSPEWEDPWLDPERPFAAVETALRPYPHELDAHEDPPRQPDLFG